MRLDYERVFLPWFIVRREIQASDHFNSVRFPLDCLHDPEVQVCKLGIQIEQERLLLRIGVQSVDLRGRVEILLDGDVEWRPTRWHNGKIAVTYRSKFCAGELDLDWEFALLPGAALYGVGHIQWEIR